MSLAVASDAQRQKQGIIKALYACSTLTWITRSYITHRLLPYNNNNITKSAYVSTESDRRPGFVG